MSRPTLAERVAQHYDDIGEATAFARLPGGGRDAFALAALVRAGQALKDTSLAVFQQPHTLGDTARWLDARRNHDTALSALAAALGVTEEA